MTDFDYYQSEYQDDYEPEPLYENYIEHEHDIYEAQ
jgi:hypothetical protein